MSGRSPADVVQRFQSLRGYGLLPKSRGKNAQHLSVTEIVAGVLSLATPQPGFAGLVSKVLMNLRPVGGIEASFAQCDTFGKAVEAILNNSETLNSLIEVRVSDSEHGVNSNGLAAIDYIANNTQKTAYYIGSTATSVLQSGAERTFDSRQFSPIVTQTVYYPLFFKRLDLELQREMQEPAVPSDVYPEEEDEEREDEERARRLGLTPGSRFLNVGVDNQVDWPNTETVVDFEGYKLILMPKTRDNMTSVHIDLPGQRIGAEEALTRINHFLSMLAWCNDQFAMLQDWWSGNPVPVAVPKRNLAFTTTQHWIFNRRSPTSSAARKAISIYREGRNAEQNHLISYAVLAYYKIIEINYSRAVKVKLWLRENYKILKQDRLLAERIKAFETARGNKTAEEYLYSACRTAIAHANTPYSADPDDFREIRRLHIAADILRPLARLFIRNELGVSDSITIVTAAADP